MSPPASWFMVPVMERIGAPIERDSQKKKPIEALTAKMWNTPTVPMMSTGATDSKYFRAAGIPMYGVSGLFGDSNDVRAHGRDERVGVKQFYDSQEFLYRLVKLLTARPVS